MTKRVQAVDRAIDLLMCLVPGPKSLTEVCKATDLSKPTAFRILSSLGERGLVLKDPAQELKYMLGPNLLPLVQGVSLGLGMLGTVAQPVLLEVREQTEETVTLHVQVGIERVCIEEIRSPHALQYTASVGSRSPIHVGAAGKVLLAFLGLEQRERSLAALPNPLESLTGETITDVEALRSELTKVRDQGWAISTGERVSGASAVSIPVFAHDQLVSALSVLGPSTRLPKERLKELAGELEVVSGQISELLEGKTKGSDRT